MFAQLSKQSQQAKAEAKPEPGKPHADSSQLNRVWQQVATRADPGSQGSNQRPLAITESGRTLFDPRALGHPRFPEIAAHEAVHRGQFHAAGKPVGSVSQLESDAAVGARSLLSGDSHIPAFRALPGQALAWPTDPFAGSDDPTVSLSVVA
jgi:hypothetical protein